MQRVCGLRAGIFIPSLTIGGAWGRLIGMLVQACLASSGSTLRVSLPAYTVCGPYDAPLIHTAAAYTQSVCMSCSFGHLHARSLPDLWSPANCKGLA